MAVTKIDVSNLYGSSVIDAAIAQVFNTSPIDMKIKEIGDLLYRTHRMVNFGCIFDMRSMNFKFRVEFEDACYNGAIPDVVMRNEPAPSIVNAIMDMIWDYNFNPISPEWISENENEQAMLDAAMDYGFV